MGGGGGGGGGGDWERGFLRKGNKKREKEMLLKFMVWHAGCALVAVRLAAVGDGWHVHKMVVGGDGNTGQYIDHC